MSKYYKVLESKAVILRKRVGQIGEFVRYAGSRNEMIELKFSDRVKLCCFPMEIERIDEEQIKKENLHLMNLTEADVEQIS